MMKPEKLHSSMTLYIATGTDESTVALFSSEGLLYLKSWNGRGELSEKLISEIDSLLFKNSVKKEELVKIAVLTGPGSYTGLRIGITVANFLSWSLKIPIVKASIFEKKLNCDSIKDNYALPYYSSEPKNTKPRNS